MFEQFTDDARKVMALANQEAQRWNHEYIGTEHILLGLVKEGSGVGSSVLRNLGIDLRKVRLEVEKLVKRGPEMVTMGKLPQTPRAKRVIEFAVEEARRLNHNYVGTEHLLLGLLRETDGVAAAVLMNLGLKLEDVRDEVLNLLGAGGASRESGMTVGVPDMATESQWDWALSAKSNESVPGLLLRCMARWELLRTAVRKLESEKDDALRLADYERVAHVRDRVEQVKEQIRALNKFLPHLVGLAEELERLGEAYKS